MGQTPSLVHSVHGRKLSFPARFLLRFCRAPEAADFPMSGVHYKVGHELDRLREVFPNISSQLAGKLVVDFGCAFGYQSVAFSRCGARHVVGIEIEEASLQEARKLVMEQDLVEKVTFEKRIAKGLNADVIVSQNSFEHFLDATEILTELRKGLAPDGKIFVTFAPPWYAAWGSHMAYFCRLPWVQLFFSERTVMEVRSLFRSDGARTYRDAGLAEMSLAKFERTVKESGLSFELKRYDCSRGLDWLQSTPLRELFVNRVSCIMVHPQ